MTDQNKTARKSVQKTKSIPKKESNVTYSEHQIWLKNIGGLNEVDLEEIFADYDSKA